MVEVLGYNILHMLYLLVDSFVFEVMWCISSVQSLPLWLVLDVSVKVSALLHQESNTRFSLLQKYKKTEIPC